MAGHTHGATSGRLLWISLGLTLGFVGLELFAGLAAHSLALLSDAGHNFSDALALGLAAYAVWIARRPATHGKTFGYHRVAILAALINAASLVVIAFAILAEAWHALREPQPVQSGLMIGVAAVAFVMNTVVAYMLRDASHRNLNARAVYVHMAGDALSSLGVVIAGLVIRWTEWALADPLVSVLIAAFILFSSWGVIKEATDILLEGTPKAVDVEALVAAMRDTPPVMDVHDLHIWTVGDGLNFLSCHVVVPEETTIGEATAMIARLNERLHDEFGIGHATIQSEFLGSDGCRADADALLCALETHDHDHGHHHHHHDGRRSPIGRAPHAGHS